MVADDTFVFRSSEFMSGAELCGIGATFDRCHLSGIWRFEKILDHISVVGAQDNPDSAALGQKDGTSLLAGDKVIAIDDRVATDLSPQDFAKLIMGPEGSSVTLTLRRAISGENAAATDPAEIEFRVVARRSRRTTPFFQPLSASAEGLKAVFRLLGGGGAEEGATAAAAASKQQPSESSAENIIYL
jgi:hypothetical protein